MFVELVVALVAVLVVYLIKQNTKPRGFPPGPTGIPVLGYLPFMTKEPEQKFRQLAKKYGDIFGLIMGNKKTIVLNDLETIKEAFKEEVFSGRPAMPLIHTRTDGKEKGLIFTSGQNWHEQRRFALRHLRDLGFGKKQLLEDVTAKEVSSLIRGLRKDIGKTIQLRERFHLAVINTLWSIVTSTTYEHDDPKLLRVFDCMRKFTKLSNVLGAVTFTPWLYKVLPSSMTGINLFKEVTKILVELADAEIRRHQKTFDENNVRDLIDAYLVEIKRTTDSTSQFFQSEGYLSLRAVVFDMFIGGTDTTSNTLQWVFMMLLKHPQVKNRILSEIDASVGSDRMVTLDDRSNMPYTEATILETLRYSSLVPLSLPHETTEDKEFKGYHIPKGTVIMCNLLSVHHDPNRWQDPLAFKPERFLTSDGRLKRNDALMPFSSGKRVCIGERLAQDEMFIFTANILQQLEISLPPGEHTPAKEYTSVGTRMPAEYNIIFKDRVKSREHA